MRSRLLNVYQPLVNVKKVNFYQVNVLLPKDSIDFVFCQNCIENKPYEENKPNTDESNGSIVKDVMKNIQMKPII